MNPTTRKLKVYRTSAGFCDAYVAAPTQKAAVEAWGADPGTFARGDAEIVTDPKLTAEPLAHPGMVIRKKRGDLAQQLAALGPDRRKRAPKAASEPKPTPKKRASRPKPKPSRDPLERAEEALRKFESEAADRLAELRAWEEALAKERRQLERRNQAQRTKLSQAVDALRDEYERALERWRASFD